MRTFSVILVDDHALVRAGLRQLITTFEKFSVIAEAGDGLDAIAEVQKHKPDILILDIAMPRMRGIEAINEIKKISPKTRILVLSMHDREEYMYQTLQKGADGYILKESAAEELLAALNNLSRGEIYLSPTVSRTILADWLRDERRGDKKIPVKNELTDREKAVLKLVAEGLSNREVADLLHISSKTVETHRFRIMEKLKLQSLPDLVKYAIKKGFVEL